MTGALFALYMERARAMDAYALTMQEGTRRIGTGICVDLDLLNAVESARYEVSRIHDELDSITRGDVMPQVPIIEWLGPDDQETVRFFEKELGIEHG